MNPAYTQEQQAFLENFYQGVTDPEIKLSMLITATGGGTVCFHATGLSSKGTLEGFSDAEILIATKIACVEHDLLIFNGLLVPHLY